jgi:hypothetical protein
MDAMIRKLIESLSHVTEKQGIILELLANKLPDLADKQKQGLLRSANENFAHLKEWKVALDSLESK